LEADVKTQKLKSQGIPQHDYQTAIQGALSWLGDRYLLAEPVNRRSDEYKLQASEPRGSQPASVPAGTSFA